MARIAVIGAGSFGTCLTKLLSDSGHDVTLWAYEAELVETLRATRVNADYLPGFELASTVAFTNDLAEAVSGKSIVLGVTPSHVARKVLGAAVPHMDPDTIVVNASKGLEEGTLERIDQIYGEILPPAMAARAVYLSGPTFAKEVAAHLPSAIVVAGHDESTRDVVQAEFSSLRFRVYVTDDVVGVLLGGALKNVVAIAAGMSDGLGFGLNARAALITRGLAELARIGVSQGANPMTFQGLSGMGDLVLTCSGDLSRNRRVGLALGAGKKLDEIIADMKMVAEGVKTTRVARDLARKIGVPAPITEFMYGVLYEDKPARDALAQLMGRDLKHERD